MTDDDVALIVAAAARGGGFPPAAAATPENRALFGQIQAEITGTPPAVVSRGLGWAAAESCLTRQQDNIGAADAAVAAAPPQPPLSTPPAVKPPGRLGPPGGQPAVDATLGELAGDMASIEGTLQALLAEAAEAGQAAGGDGLDHSQDLAADQAGQLERHNPHHDHRGRFTTPGQAVTPGTRKGGTGGPQRGATPPGRPDAELGAMAGQLRTAVAATRTASGAARRATLAARSASPLGKPAAAARAKTLAAQALAAHAQAVDLSARMNALRAAGRRP